MKANLFTNIEQLLSLVPHGWCSVRKAQTLASMILAIRPRLVVEIGVYGGRSFLPMVQALHTVGHGKAVGIDPYDAAVSAANETPANAEWWGGLDHEAIKQGLYEVLHAVPEFAPHWEILERRSDEVRPSDICASVSACIGLLHVDGAHTEQAIRDVRRFAPLVEAGGWVVLDDLLWEGGAVSESVKELDGLGFVERFRMIGPEDGTHFTDNWGVFQRVG